MEIHKFGLGRDDAALIVIDIQERLAAAMNGAIMAQVIRNAGILITTAKLFGMPILASEQYRKGLGSTVGPVQEKLSGVDVIEKLDFDCTKDAGLRKKIDGIGRKKFIIAGIEAHVCVFQTGLSLLGMGRDVFVASDAVASRRRHDWEYSLRALAQAGAVVYPTETIAFMLMGKAGTDDFKKLAPLFK